MTGPSIQEGPVRVFGIMLGRTASLRMPDTLMDAPRMAPGAMDT
jgi:hypothetical protein